MIEQLSQDKGTSSPSIEEFVGYMGEDLYSLDLNSNIDKFAEPEQISSGMGNPQIVITSLVSQLGQQDSDYQDINKRLALETPSAIVQAFREIDISQDIRAKEMGLGGGNLQAIPSFMDLVEGHISKDLPVEEFRTELLSYAVVLSLKNQYKHNINRRLYLKKSCVAKALKEIME